MQGQKENIVHCKTETFIGDNLERREKPGSESEEWIPQLVRRSQAP